ncbi:MAG TPA: regulator, partial [Pseudonocardiaceae bacterium]|nr:regulator [Pseudonocardiaceae bacterium]
FVIDKRYYWAAGYCVAAAALSFIGLIHGEQVRWAASPGIALGYLFAAVICLVFSLGSTPAPAAMPDEHEPAAAQIPAQTPAQPGPTEVATEPAR